MISGDAFDFSVVDSEGLGFFEMAQSIGEVPGLELGKPKQAPGRAQIRREPDNMQERGLGVCELIRAILERPEIPPALLPFQAATREHDDSR